MGVLKITLVIGSFLAMCILNNQGDDTMHPFFPSANISLMIDTHAPTPNGKIGGICENLLLVSK